MDAKRQRLYQPDISTYGRIKNMARNCLVLTLLLGITWLFGFPMAASCLKCNEYATKIFSVIFIVLNCCNGIFIFIYSIILDSKMLESTKLHIQRNSRKISRLSMSNGTSSTGRIRTMSESLSTSFKNVMSSKRKIGSNDRKISNSPTLDTNLSLQVRNSNASDQILIKNLSKHKRISS